MFFWLSNSMGTKVDRQTKFYIGDFLHFHAIDLHFGFDSVNGMGYKLCNEASNWGA